MYSLTTGVGRWMHVALALLVVAQMGHCAWEWQAVLSQVAEVAAYRARNESLPILPQRGCHNETGCMCRGATQAVAVDVADFAASQSDLLPVMASEVALVDESSARVLSAGWFERPPSCYGRLLRARMASFLI
jgi:hypothetical protein